MLSRHLSLCPHGRAEHTALHTWGSVCTGIKSRKHSWRWKNEQKSVGPKVSGNRVALIFHSSNPTPESCLTLEVRQCVCVCVCVCVRARVCVLKRELEATAAGWLLSRPPTRMLGAWDPLMSVGLEASMSPASWLTGSGAWLRPGSLWSWSASLSCAPLLICSDNNMVRLPSLWLRATVAIRAHTMR